MKRFVGIFAHPDDESLGPSGAIATFAKDHEVYLICVTSGEAAGVTEEEKMELAELRKEEIRHSSKILGVKDVFFLGYRDGDLCNNIYHRLANDIQDYLVRLQPEVIMTFNTNGVSGHIDHVTVSLVTTFVFHKLSFIKKLYYYCVPLVRSEGMKDYFIHFPQGITREQADEVIDTSEVWDKQAEAMVCHKSQAKDVERVLASRHKYPKEEYFLVSTKAD